MSGFSTRIFEMHSAPGGLCTSWHRQGYTINGCLQWLVDTAPSSGFYRIWEELGAVQRIRFVNHEEFVRIEGVNGDTFIQYSNLDRLERQMLDIAPEDEETIRKFINGARDYAQVGTPIEDSKLHGAAYQSKVLTFKTLHEKWSRRTVGEFFSSIKSTKLRKIIDQLWHPSVPASFILMILSFLHRGEVGYPVGGSLEFSRAIERRYMSLGGEVHHSSKVVKILVENDRAFGVKLDDGSEYHADYVISAADGHATIFEMLGGRYTDSTVRSYYECLPTFPPLLHIALGVNHSFEEVPPIANGISFTLLEPIKVAGMELNRLGVVIFNFDPTLAPPGKTLVKVLLNSDYDYWERIHKCPDRYRSEKDQVANQIVALLEKRFPGFEDHVEMRDVATPITFHRYTGNWKGSYEGWLLTQESSGLQMSKTLPGLDNFYMAGQWVEPGGGVPTSAISGRSAIQIICNRENIPFLTSVQ